MRHLGLVVAALALVCVAPVSGRAQATQAEVVGRVEALIDALAAGRVDEVVAAFDDRMRAALPAPELAAIWAAAEQQAGRFERRIGATTRTKDAYVIVTMTCAFARANVDIQFVLDAEGKVGGLAMKPAAMVATAPPPYARADAYTEHDVVTGAEGWPLPGTLTMPVGAGPFPAVVLVHGSGPQDRDASIGPNRIFRDLAVGLASRGVAVLRYEKRPRQHGPRVAALLPMTVQDEVVEDALAAAGLLRRAARVDSARVFVLGHSLGGMLAPRVLDADPLIAGAIVLAGAVRPIEQALVEQTRYLIVADGQLSDGERTQLMQAEQLAASVRALTPDDAGRRELIAGAPPSYWLDLRGYDPARLASQLSQPFLILQGERDYQVTMADFARWRAALESRANVTLRAYPGLNHLFMRGVGPSLPSEYMTPGHLDADVVGDIASWVTTVAITP